MDWTRCLAGSHCVGTSLSWRWISHTTVGKHDVTLLQHTVVGLYLQHGGRNNAKTKWRHCHPINTKFSEIENFHCPQSVADSKGRGGWGAPYWLRFFSISRLFPYSSLYAFAINDDGAGTLSPPALFKIFGSITAHSHWCLFMCSARWSLRANVRWQTAQRNGRSPVCLR